MNLNDVHRGIQKYKKRKRLGRGPGSGQGKTAGRGSNGAGSRAGASMPPTFEGGQMPLVRRVPKRGFHNKFAEEVVAVNVGELEKVFAAGESVSPETVRAKRLIKRSFDELKILGEGSLTKSLKIAAHKFSKSAQEKIQQAGGEITVLPGKAPVVKNQKKQQNQKQ
ncbi:MAG: 50S ribosomal protein L15 [Thermoguttaceae bacterium]|jgi:large subunit ribosomal protein L15